MAKSKNTSAGARSELIAIERETTIPDEQGGTAVTWMIIGQMWADLQWLSGGEMRTDKGRATRERAKYRAVALSAAVEELSVTVKDRVIWSGAHYEIIERPRSSCSVNCDLIIEHTGGHA